MSASAVKWASRQTIEDRTLKDVLRVLAAFAKNDVCQKLQPQIADAAGIKERAARNALLALEGFGLIQRSRRLDWAKRGRPADTIKLSTNRDFCITKEMIMAARSMGPTGISSWDQPAPNAGAPTHENGGSLYKERARSVLVETFTKPLSVSTRVRFDGQREKWRASVTAAGITMELGRFDGRGEAEDYADQSEKDICRTSSMKAGTPSFPIIDPSKANLDAPHIGTWLFGCDGEEPDENGAGEASALGQGTKFLAGLGGAHDLTEYDAGRA